MALMPRTVAAAAGRAGFAAPAVRPAAGGTPAAGRTWVLLTEAAVGGWGIAGTALRGRGVRRAPRLTTDTDRRRRSSPYPFAMDVRWWQRRSRPWRHPSSNQSPTRRNKEADHDRAA